MMIMMLTPPMKNFPYACVILLLLWRAAKRRSLLQRHQSDYSYQRAINPSTSTRVVVVAAAAPACCFGETFCFHHAVTVTLFYAISPIRLS